MSESLFAQLKRIGVDEELAHQVSVSLDPDYNGSKKDVLVVQQAMLQLQARIDECYFELKTEMIKGFADVRSEMHRRYRITFGGLITTIFSVFAVNWYFH